MDRQAPVGGGQKINLEPGRQYQYHYQRQRQEADESAGGASFATSGTASAASKAIAPDT